MPSNIKLKIIIQSNFTGHKRRTFIAWFEEDISWKIKLNEQERQKKKKFKKIEKERSWKRANRSMRGCVLTYSKINRLIHWLAKQPLQVACFSEDVKCWGAWELPAAQSQGHHTIGRLEERCVERGNAGQTNQTNIGTVSKATLGKPLRDRVERILYLVCLLVFFPSAQNRTELTDWTSDNSDWVGLEPRGAIAQWAERRTEKPDNTDAGSIPQSDKGLFSQSQPPVQTLCPYSPRVQSHVSASVSTLKIPNTGSHTIVWSHKNTPHTGGRNG